MQYAVCTMQTQQNDFIGLTSAYCLLLTAQCLLPTAYCFEPTAF